MDDFEKPYNKKLKGSQTITSNKSTKSTKFKKNSEPITSYGIILYTLENNKPYFLLYQRRDSFEYMDFLRGIWKNESSLPSLFSGMTISERERIRNYTYKELWDDLWIEHTYKIYNDGLSRGQRKYESIKDMIPELLNKTQSTMVTPPWGFPKGKRNSPNEKDMDCALREFQEETHIPKNSIKIVDRIPIIENFKGSNGKSYSTQYFLAFIDKKIFPEKIQTPNCIRKETVSEEASEINWFTIDSIKGVLDGKHHHIIDEIRKRLI